MALDALDGSALREASSHSARASCRPFLNALDLEPYLTTLVGTLGVSLHSFSIHYDSQ